MANQLHVTASLGCPASPTSMRLAAERNYVAARTSTSSLVTALVALVAFLAVPTPSTAQPNGSANSSTSKPSYWERALPDTYAFTRGSPGDSQEKQGLAWLDDHRLMFVGFTPGKADSHGLYVWDTAANLVSLYSNHTEFCFADGYISAFGPSEKRADRTALSPVRQGTLGKERDSVCDSRTGIGCRGRLNMSCQSSKYFGKAPLGEYSRYVFELRTGDGAIVDPVDKLAVLEQLRNKNLAEKQAFFNQPLLLVHERFPKGKPLPITALEQLIAWRATYSKYVDRYVFVTERPKDGIPGYTSIWPPGKAQPVYLMSRDGNVEEIDVPAAPDRSKIHLASAAVPGIVFLGTGGPRNGWGGLFLYDKHQVWQLDRGEPQTLAVSNNGCKVAYAIDNEYSKKPHSYLRIKFVGFC